MISEESRPSQHAASNEPPRKRRRITHQLRHVQKRPQNVELASQDPVSTQSQLLRSLVTALSLSGFDSVKPSALEMFRAATESYMLRFLHYLRISMQANRRTAPTALDFASALALMPNASRASLLKPQLALSIPEDVSYPSIPEPEPGLPPAPDFSALLKSLMPTVTPAYIPRHFPSLPPHHAWKSTPVWPEREVDARKMREKAMEEGLLAEQALRKLAAAAKAGVARAEKRRDTALSGPGKSRAGELIGRRTRPRLDSEEMFADMLRQAKAEEDPDGNGQAGDDADTDAPYAVVVNYDMARWRHTGRKRLQL